MSEMTPEMEDLRWVAGHLADIGEGSYCRRVDKALRAWEADIARREALEADRGHLMILKSVTQAQAMDEAIWGVAVTAMEVYLQRSLRYLHALIEGHPYDGPR